MKSVLFGVLGSEKWQLLTDVSGQSILPICKGEEEEILEP